MAAKLTTFAVENGSGIGAARLPGFDVDVIENQPRHPKVIADRIDELCTRGIRLLNSYYVEEALSCFTKAIYLDQNVGTFYAYRGDAYVHMCDFRSAYLNYLKADRLMPGHPVIQSRLVNILFVLGRISLAENSLQMALDSFIQVRSMDSRNPLYWIYLVRTYGSLRDYEGVEATLSEVLDTLHLKAETELFGFVTPSLQSGSGSQTRALAASPHPLGSTGEIRGKAMDSNIAEPAMLSDVNYLDSYEQVRDYLGYLFRRAARIQRSLVQQGQSNSEDITALMNGAARSTRSADLDEEDSEEEAEALLDEELAENLIGVNPAVKITLTGNVQEDSAAALAAQTAGDPQSPRNTALLARDSAPIGLAVLGSPLISLNAPRDSDNEHQVQSDAQEGAPDSHRTRSKRKQRRRRPPTATQVLIRSNSASVAPELLFSALLLRARLRIASGSYVLALADASLARALIPRHPGVFAILESLMDRARAATLRAQALLLRGLPSPARLELDTAATISPSDPAIYVLRARALRLSGYYDAALSDIKIARSLLVRHLVSRQGSTLPSNDPEERSGRTALIEFSPDCFSTGEESPNAGSNDSPGKALSNSHEEPRVESPESLLIRVNEELGLILCELGIDYCRNGHYLPAIPVFNRAIQFLSAPSLLEPPAPAPPESSPEASRDDKTKPSASAFKAYLARGDAYQALGELDLALADYRSALSLSAHFLNGVTTAFANSAVEGGVSLADHLVIRVAPIIGVFGGHGIQGNNEPTQLTPQGLNALLRSRLAQIYQELGRAAFNEANYSAACDWFTQALAQSTGHPALLAARGRCRAKLGHLIEAFNDLEQAASIAPTHPSGWKLDAESKACLENLRRMLLPARTKQADGQSRVVPLTSMGQNDATRQPVPLLTVAKSARNTLVLREEPIPALKSETPARLTHRKSQVPPLSSIAAMQAFTSTLAAAGTTIATPLITELNGNPEVLAAQSDRYYSKHALGLDWGGRKSATNPGRRKAE